MYLLTLSKCFCGSLIGKPQAASSYKKRIEKLEVEVNRNALEGYQQLRWRITCAKTRGTEIAHFAVDP